MNMPEKGVVIPQGLYDRCKISCHFSESSIYKSKMSGRKKSSDGVDEIPLLHFYEGYPFELGGEFVCVKMKIKSFEGILLGK